MRNLFRMTTVATCVITTLSLSAAKNESFHKGEDGELYLIEQAIDKSSNNKIEPTLLAQAKSDKPLDIIVFVKGDDLSKKFSAIEKRYEMQLNDLSERLKMVDKKYRPQKSLSEKEEQAFMKSKAAQMSDRDKALTRSLKKELDELLDKQRKEKAEIAAEAAQHKLDDMAQVIKSLGGEVREKVALGNAVSATIPATLLQQIADYPEVVKVAYDHPVDYELDVSMPSARYPTWHNDGFDGYPYDFGIVDSGVRENHPAFNNPNLDFCSKSGASVTGDHGTHVAGIVISNNNTYKGTAYGTDSVIWANSGAQSTTMSNMQWMITGNCQGPEVVNHSLGYGIADDTDYSASDAFYDAFVQNYNVMVTKSTGNSGWSDTTPRITHPAPAYNLMAVANMDDRNTATRSDDVRRSSSSVGPTLNNRKKPDIAAPGTSIMSTNSDWATEADFIAKTGTSMAAPHVAGAIILMEDGGNHTPMAQKAVLINTADAWDSNNTSTTSDDGFVAGSHWDKSYGWGYIDMWESHFNRGDYFVSSVIPRNNNNVANDYKLFKGKMYTNEKATLVWQRRANFASGPSGSAYNLSDLNLRLYGEGSNTLVDYDFDGNDNVHQIAAPSTMDAVIKVYAWSSSFDGASSELFALATEENFSAVSPPLVQVPSQYFSGNANSPVYLSVRVNNNGGVDTCNVSVTRGSVRGVSGTTSASIGPVADGSYSTAGFTLSASAGTYSIPFTATTTCYNETYSDSGTITFRAF